MFLIDKLRVYLYNFSTSIVYHFLFWNLFLIFYLYLTGENSVIQNVIDYNLYVNVLLLSMALSFSFTLLDAFTSNNLMRYSPIKVLAVAHYFFYFLIGMFIIFYSVNNKIIGDTSKLSEFGASLSNEHVRFFIWFIFSSILNNFVRGVFRKIGFANFFKWFSGSLNKPKMEKRIFMFIDMKSSVTIAEKLGHQKFSYLVQDVFSDLSIVENYNAAIYQYLGDGAIISWSLKNGVKNNNCLKAFFAFQHIIKKRSGFYNFRYGLVPEFKAGLHVGEIMVLQIGRFKRDISYNGDTLNTTARIESMCNSYGQNLLISGELYNILNKSEFYEFVNVDNIKLKGKQSEIEIYKASLLT